MQKTLKRYFPIFVLPTLIAFSFAFIIPFVMGVYLSFCKFKTITNAQFVGLENYIKIFADKDFVNAFGFTLKFSVGSFDLSGQRQCQNERKYINGNDGYNRKH